MEQPLIHGIYSLETPVENRSQFDDAVRAIRDHFRELLNKMSERPPIADGAPTVVEEAGGLEYKTTDEFWIYELDYDFWKNLAEKFSDVSLSVYYGSVIVGEKCGMFLSVDGLVTDIRYEDGSMDALEFSKSLNEMDGLHEDES